MHAEAQVMKSRTAAIVSWSGGSARVDFEGVEAASADFLLPLTLLPAMASDDAGLALPSGAPARLRRQAGELQHLFTHWFPDRFAPVELSLLEAVLAPAPESSRGTAAFFSGGVDSFFTALELSGELDAVIHVTGFDHGIGRVDEPDEHTIDAAIACAADALGLELLRVRTNLRAFSDRFVLWGDHYVGSALATVATLLAGRFRLVYVPATHTYDDLFPYGTHPLVEPLWSTDAVELRLHGCNVPRPAKITRVARSQAALDALRVCWHNPGGSTTAAAAASACSQRSRCAASACSIAARRSRITSIVMRWSRSASRTPATRRLCGWRATPSAPPATRTPARSTRS
jgi:hypothetical protein